MVEIDGGSGEGGGQIIRTALSLSVLSGKPFCIRNIRRNRPKPGLRAQHLAAVRALKAISGARVEGDALDSQELRFEPSAVRGGAYRMDIGTAGATSLVLQALLPPLIFADRESHLVLTGGTHVPISPPFHFIRHVFLPALAMSGIRATASIERYGFYPRGGGEIDVHLWPYARGPLPALIFPEKKAISRVSGVSAVANLPLSIAERQKSAALGALKGAAARTEIETRSVPSPGRGTFLFLKAEGGPCGAGFSSIGIRGKRAEMVGAEAAEALLAYVRRDGCLDPHLADQIVLYLAIAAGRSAFTTTQTTSHLVTNIGVITRFLDVEYDIEGEIGSPGKVSVTGVGHHRNAV